MSHAAESNATSETSSRRPLLQAAVVALLLLLVTAGVESYRDLATARDQEATLRRQIEATRIEIGRLQEHVRRIDDDPHDVVIVLPEEPGPAGESDTGS